MNCSSALALRFKSKIISISPKLMKLLRSFSAFSLFLLISNPSTDHCFRKEWLVLGLAYIALASSLHYHHLTYIIHTIFNIPLVTSLPLHIPLYRLCALCANSWHILLAFNRLKISSHNSTSEFTPELIFVRISGIFLTFLVLRLVQTKAWSTWRPPSPLFQQ